MNWIGKKIKEYWFTSVLKFIKSFLVGYISYYFFRQVTEINSLKEILGNDERMLLSLYASIQVGISFIFFEVIGHIIDFHIKEWIKDSIHQTDLDKTDIKELKRVIKWLVQSMLALNIITIDELEKLDEIEHSEEEFSKKWERTVYIIKSLLGILILTTGSTFIKFDNSIYGIISFVLTIGIIGSTIIGLFIYKGIITNIHLINQFIKGYNASVRLEVSKNKIEHKTALPKI